MESADNITKTYDPFLKLKEYNESHIPTASSPKLKQQKEATKEEKDDLLSSPVVKEFNPNLSPKALNLSPKALSLTQKVDAIIDIIDNQLYKETAADVDDKTVLVEWEPTTEKAVHEKDKTDKVFVKWTKDVANKSVENLQNLEKDYLSLSKLEQQKEDIDTTHDK